MPRVPPRLATWLLTRVRNDEPEDSLVGDLIEEYQAGRSAAWYWKQTLVILALTLLADLRNHKLLAFRATVFGGLLLWLFGVVQRPVLALAFPWLLEAGLTIGTGWVLPLAFWGPLWLFTGMCAGWILGWTHKSIWGVAVVLAAVVQVLYNARWTWELAAVSVSQPRYRPYLAGVLASQLILILGLLAGGLLSTTEARRQKGARHPRSPVTL